MRECWLKPNRRALAVVMAGPLSLAVIGLGLVTWGLSQGAVYLFVGCGLTLAGGAGFLLLGYAMSLPRLAYQDGYLLVFLGSPKPYRVPIEIVEVFFLGQGPVKPDDQADDGPKTANVVVRLAEAASDWHQRDIRPDLGRWSDGYIVIRGTWCEPLSHDRLNVLNHRLAEVHRARRADTAGSQPSKEHAAS